jgi:ABC-type Fe3+/spermidine/putrescine transport system ATPase subunit
LFFLKQTLLNSQLLLLLEEPLSNQQHRIRHPLQGGSDS